MFALPCEFKGLRAYVRLRFPVNAEHSSSNVFLAANIEFVKSNLKFIISDFEFVNRNGNYLISNWEFINSAPGPIRSNLKVISSNSIL